MIKVSILVPVYNVEPYLRQCLDSIVHQTLQEIEVICVDDGSTDESGHILDEYACKYSCIKVIHKENFGYGKTMNCAMKAAVGIYVGIVESDDFIDCNMFENLYCYGVQNKADIVKSNYWGYTNSKDSFCEILALLPYNKNFSMEGFKDKFFICTKAIWSAIYRRSFLMENDIWFNETPGASYQDVSFAVKTLSCAKRIFCVKDAFLHYRMDNPNSSVKSKGKIYCIFDEFSNMDLFLQKRERGRDEWLGFLSYLKYIWCQESYHRIAIRYRRFFLLRMIKEFKKIMKQGYLHERYWEKEKWSELMWMLNNTNHFLFTMNNRNQKMQMLCSGFWQQISNFSQIYLYGAGKVARKMIEIFRESKIQIFGCLVSDMESNPASLLGIPVQAYDSVELEKENSAILIAIKEEFQYDVLQKLLEDGYENVISLDKDLRESLEVCG